MMRVVLFCCCLSSLHLLLCAAPLTEGGAAISLQGSPHSSSHVVLKRRGRHKQDTLTQPDHSKSVLVSRNETGFWSRPRCGVPDYSRVAPVTPVTPVTLPNGSKLLKRSRKERGKRFALFGGRWDKSDLTYRIVRFPWQMSEDKVRRILEEAFGVWGAVTPLTFREVISERADIIIDFNRYRHGDDLPFDGPGGILAHAFFPRTLKEGEVHFDYDEHWTVGNGIGTDLLQVAAHEFGHVLGLQHSLEPDAVMCPFYSDSYPLKLSEDDKKGIQYLYGAPRYTPPDVTETNEIEPELPDACRTSFDAVSMIRGELFFFRAQYVWRIRDRRLQGGYPALSSRHWSGIPDYIDAAYEDKSGNIWFFQGDNYWVFDAGRRISGPDSLQRLGLPVTDIQAALRWEDGGSEKVYLFKSSFYWSFSVQENRVGDLHPRSTHEWAGLPGHIDAAFLDSYGYANFLSGLYYWKLDPVALKVLDGYPRRIGTDFFGCSESA